MSKFDSKTSSIPVTDVDRTPVAKDIWCYSTREKAFTWHVVINHDAQGYVDRVQCKVTGSVHKYKRQNKSTKPTTSTERKVVRRDASGKIATPASTSTRALNAKAQASATLEQTWFDGVKRWGDKPVIDYSPDKFLDKGYVLEHSAFGKGVVQARRDNKADVLFKIGVKTLPTARKA